jgi:hypothetical protein
MTTAKIHWLDKEFSNPVYFVRCRVMSLFVKRKWNGCNCKACPFVRQCKYRERRSFAAQDYVGQNRRGVDG